MTSETPSSRPEAEQETQRPRMPHGGIPTATERVLSTLNPDGTRRWLRPRPSPGRHLRRRFVVGWTLICVFVALPLIRIGGKPAILLDVARREFTLFGSTFLATDFALLMLLLVGIFVSVFLVTALVGRAWCGWACPQTVYLELLFRPLERLIEGPISEQRRMDREGWGWRRWLKMAVFLVLSAFLGHTFLAYFVGWDALIEWMGNSPAEHPAPFLVMAVTTALVFFDFAWFREQTCTLACPYGRLQSVMLDRDSLIVGYDPKRGEPRKPLKARQDPSDGGDCIDCLACVTTCPTGIDIREGLQMECVGCAQCIDACNAIMDRVGKPRGLIRYSSQRALEGETPRLLRPRVILYPLVLVAAFGLLGYRLSARTSADVTVLRGIGAPFSVLTDGRVSNQLRLKIVNRTSEPQTYGVELVELPEATVVAPEMPLRLEPGQSRTTAVFVTVPPSSIPGGERPVTLRVKDESGTTLDADYVLLGPRAGASDGASP